MGLYRKKPEFTTIAPAEPLNLWLRAHCPVLREESEPPLFGVREAFYVNEAQMKEMLRIYKNVFTALRLGSLIQMCPLNYEQTEMLIYVLDESGSFTPTCSKTHCRLPKLSHLITLSPNDFFALFDFLVSGHLTGTGTSFTIDAAVPLPPTIMPFLVTNTKTWRTNPEYNDLKWITWDDIKFIAELEHSELSQLYAMQYLTARYNKDLLYFPLDSAVGLELDWEQINEDYVVPEAAEGQ